MVTEIMFKKELYASNCHMRIMLVSDLGDRIMSSVGLGHE